METKSSVALEKVSGKIQTSTREVAAHFGKQHKNILRVVDDLLAEGKHSEIQRKFTGLNFEPSEYIDVTGRKVRMYYMTRDGFVLLVGKLTGVEATEWKIKYIEAFNEMEAGLSQRPAPNADSLLAWQHTRVAGKGARRGLTDTLQLKLIPLAVKQGSSHPDMMYPIYTNLVQRAFLVDVGIEIPKKDTVRDYLNIVGLTFLQQMELKLADFIAAEVEKNSHYKDIYQGAKTYVGHLGAVLGPLSQHYYLPKKGPVLRLKDLGKLLEATPVNTKKEKVNGNTKKTTKKAQK